MKRLNNRQSKIQQLKTKRRKILPKRPLSTKIGYHKKGPSRYPSM